MEYIYDELDRLQQTFNDDGTVAERIATGEGLEQHRMTFGYDPDNNMTSVATYSGGSATPNVSELAATYTSAGQLKDWSETVYPPGGGAPVTMTGSYDWAQDGLKTQNTIDGQSSTTSWLLNGLEDKFTPIARTDRNRTPIPIETGHRFRFNPDTDSDRIRTPIPEESGMFETRRVAPQ